MDHKIKKLQNIFDNLSSQTFLLPISNSIKTKLNFRRIFDNPLFKFLSKEFLGCIGYISCYLPKLEYVQYVQQVINSTRDLKIPSSKPTDVLGWALGSTDKTKHNDQHQVSQADYLVTQWPRVGFRTTKQVIKNDKQWSRIYAYLSIKIFPKYMILSIDLILTSELYFPRY